MENFDNLVTVSKTLQYIGQFLLTNSCQGHDASKHADAVALITDQFKAIQGQLESHPDFESKVAQAKEASKND